MVPMPRLHLIGGGASLPREPVPEQLTITAFVAKGTFGQVFFAKSDRDPAIVAVKVTEPVRPARASTPAGAGGAGANVPACPHGVLAKKKKYYQAFHPPGRPAHSREEQIQKYLLAQRDLAVARGGDARFDLLSLRVLADVDASGCPAFARRKFMLFSRFGKALDLLLPIGRAEDRRFVAQQVLSALSLLHTMQPFAVCHRDLKPSNVLCDPLTFQCVLGCVRTGLSAALATSTTTYAYSSALLKHAHAPAPPGVS
jgi:serine/threonine protein kinase